MTPHGPWRIVRQKAIYQDPWIAVRVDDVIRPDGNEGIHSVITIKPGVNVLALDEAGNVYLTEEFHYGVGRVTIEAVSGGIEPGEDALTTAQRELREELGIEAAEWQDLGIVDPFTANVVSPTRLFLATSLRFQDSVPEGTELIQRYKAPLPEVVNLVLEGKITHGPTCIVILKTWLQTDSSFRARVEAPIT